MNRCVLAFLMPFQYQTEDIVSDDGAVTRPRRVSGTTSLHKVTLKRPAAPLVGDVDGFDRGHVAAENLGGGNVSNNVVPMFSTFHQAGGAWRHLEVFLKAQHQAHGPLTLAVDITYTLEDVRVPSNFYVTAQTAGGVFLSYNGIALNRFPFVHAGVGPVHQDVSQDELAPVIFKTMKLIEQRDWRVEKNIDYRHPLVDERERKRPYAALDYLWVTDHKLIRKRLGKYTPGNRKKFTDRQKALILFVNRLVNDGWLRSDYGGDITTPLPSGVGGRDAVQIDHVLPVLSGGGNLFSNARICSGSFNNFKRTKKRDERKQIRF